MKKHRLGMKFIRSSSFGKLNDSNGVGLLSRDGVFYPGLPYKEGRSIHPPVTLQDDEDFGMLIEWCEEHRLKNSVTLPYRMATISYCVICNWIDTGGVPEPEEVEELTDEFVRTSITEQNVKRTMERYRDLSEEELESKLTYFELRLSDLKQELISWYVHSFLRIRAGGMFKFENEDVIYFRISSSGFDWTSTIKKFCEETFGLESGQKIWIGLDSDNRGQERRYFEGTVKELLSENLEHEVWASKKLWK